MDAKNCIGHLQTMICKVFAAARLKESIKSFQVLMKWQFKHCAMTSHDNLSKFILMKMGLGY